MDIEILNNDLNANVDPNSLSINTGATKVYENDFEQLKNKPAIKAMPNNSLKINSVESNHFLENGYINENGEFVQLNKDIPILATENDEITESGYYVFHNSLLAVNGKGYSLLYIKPSAEGKKVSEIIKNLDTYSIIITSNYRLEVKNENVFGVNNKIAGNNSITTGERNLSTGSNGIVSGNNNINDGSECIVGGQNNTNRGNNSAVFGARNEIKENQSIIAGYHNKSVEGAYFATVFGTGNMAQGACTTAHGGYNLAGSEYCSVEGMDNIAGGNVTFDGVDLAEIPVYSSTTSYIKGEMCKRNGYVYKALKTVKDYAPNPVDTEGNWEVVEPVITVAHARAAKASGEKCKSTHNGSYTHGYYLISGRTYQTVIGRYNQQDSTALFVVGNGTSKTARKNAFVVRDNNTTEVLYNLIIDSDVSGDKTLAFQQHGSTQFALRTNSNGQVILEGYNGIYVRPHGVNTTGVKFDGANVIPEKSGNVSLGSSSQLFNTVYASNISNGSTLRDISKIPTVKQITVNTTAWVDNQATVTASGVSTTKIVMCMPAPASAVAYNNSKIMCIGQSANKLTFSCEAVPTEAIKVNVLYS